jgi:hypothetical protein
LRLGHVNFSSPNSAWARRAIALTLFGLSAKKRSWINSWGRRKYFSSVRKAKAKRIRISLSASQTLERLVQQVVE